MLSNYAITYISMFIGTPYSWGGSGPSGFDCSGLAVEMLKSVGILERREDYTAEGLWERFSDNEVTTPYEGCLAFYKNKSGKVIHVEIVIGDGRLTIGASGGGSKTITREDAIRDNAFIKVRPINKNRREVLYADPFRTI